MSSKASTQKRRRLILITIFILFAFFCWFRFTPSALDRYKAQLIAQGEILDLDQLAPKRTGHEPDGDAPLLAAQQKITNGFTLRSGHIEFEHTDEGTQRLKWDTPTGYINQPNWSNAITEISARRDDFLLLHQLLKDPPKEKGSDYRDFTNYKYADGPLRARIADHLHHGVVISAYTRDASMAFTNLVTLLNLGQFHREEWTATQLGRAKITKLALEDLNYCLHLNPWTEPHLAELLEGLSATSLVTNRIQSMIMERTRQVALFDHIHQDPQAFIKKYFTPQASKKLRVSFWQNFDLDNCALFELSLEQFQIDVFRAQVNSPAWAKAFIQLDEAGKVFTESDEVWWERWRFRPVFLYPGSYAGLTSYDAKELAYVETRRQQAIAVLALERYRLKHNHYPDTLAKLLPDYLTKLPQDPMDGRPMRYRLNSDATFTLWSVGFDGKDQGGDPTVPSYQNRSFPEGALDLPWPRIDPKDLPPTPTP